MGTVFPNGGGASVSLVSTLGRGSIEFDEKGVCGQASDHDHEFRAPGSGIPNRLQAAMTSAIATTNPVSDLRFCMIPDGTNIPPNNERAIEAHRR
jgi:hypothetical protein